MKSRTKASRPLLALSTAAVMAVYGAGYWRTRSAAAKFSDAPAMRRPASPAAGVTVIAHVPAPVVEPGPPGPDRKALEPSRPRKKVAKPVITAAKTSPAPAASPAVQPAVTEPAALETKPVEAAAPAKPVEPAAPPPAPAPIYKDGTYSGWGTSRHGDIEAGVVIENGRIASAWIKQCLTRYSCSWIAHLPPQVVTRQSPEVDFVSGATQSTNAFYYAVVEALSKAK